MPCITMLAGTSQRFLGAQIGTKNINFRIVPFFSCFLWQDLQWHRCRWGNNQSECRRQMNIGNNFAFRFFIILSGFYDTNFHCVKLQQQDLWFQCTQQRHKVCTDFDKQHLIWFGKLVFSCWPEHTSCKLFNLPQSLCLILSSRIFL